MLVCFSYLVPLVHLIAFVKDIPGLENVDGRVTLICMQLASFASRVAFGMVSEWGFVRHNRVLLQQVDQDLHST